MNVAKGDRVRMTGTMPNDPAPLPVGLEGTVTGFQLPAYGMHGQIYVDWDADEAGHFRSLILLDTDPFEVVRQIWSLSTFDQNGHMITSLATTRDGLLPHALATLEGWELEENMHLHDTIDKALEALRCEGFDAHVDRHEMPS